MLNRQKIREIINSKDKSSYSSEEILYANFYESIEKLYDLLGGAEKQAKILHESEIKLNILPENASIRLYNEIKNSYEKINEIRDFYW